VVEMTSLLIKIVFLTIWSMWHLIKCDKQWTLLVKMDMGVIIWNILLINTYSQIGKNVHTLLEILGFAIAVYN